MVSVAPDQKTCSVAVIGATPAHLPLLAFTPRSAAAWTSARAAQSHSLAVLWRPVGLVPPLPPSAALLGTAGFDDCCALTPPPAFDGDSFGLAFFLAMTSLLTGVPPRAAVVALAAVDERGLTSGVGQLTAKLRALSALCPGVRGVIVAAADVSEAKDAVDAHNLNLEVTGVHNAGAAVDVVFGSLPEVLRARAGVDADRARIVGELFAFARNGDVATLVWAPVAAACSVLLEVLLEATTDVEVKRVTFARMVAVRHGENVDAGDPALNAAWRASLDATERIAAVAHLVQQSADTGRPEPQDALDLANSELGRDEFEAHSQLRGARGRLLASLGRRDEALTEQRRVAAWFLEHRPAAVTFALAEWFRLAGLVDDGGREWAAAEAFLARAVSTDAAIGRSPFVRSARAIAQLRQIPGRGFGGASCGAHALSELQAMAAGAAGVPDHIRLAACRHVAGYPFDTQGMPTPVAAQAALNAARGGADGEQPLLFDLDEACRAGNDEAIEQSLAALANCNAAAALVQRTRKYVGDDGNTVRLWYPY